MGLWSCFVSPWDWEQRLGDDGLGRGGGGVSFGPGNEIKDQSRAGPQGLLLTAPAFVPSVGPSLVSPLMVLFKADALEGSP